MALNGIQIQSLNHQRKPYECGCPTCMAFAMKGSQALCRLSSVRICLTRHWHLFQANHPPMKTIKTGTGDGEFTLEETVPFSDMKNICKLIKTRYAVALCT